ncbi:hypothetical protein MKX70_24120 [Paenibacillus sp. FSL R7-0312]|uniref:hypothetical protein n=1 Tax=Paenibacillus sp. FSL R7-0312 TaxID=2921682 RepID=UPI0030FBE16F
MRYSEFKSLISNSSPDDWIYDDDIGKYVFMGDIRISILSDRSESVGDEGFYEDWARSFPDKNAVRKKYFLQFNDSIIEQFYTVAVDGHRSYIPYPVLNTMTITKEQYAIGEILNSIHGYSFDEYLQRSRITIQ